MTEFEGRVICVTGGSRGIGYAAAEAFAGHGARLLLLSSSERVQEAAEKLRSRTAVLACRCDVSDIAAVQDAVGRALGEWGRIDVLVNAAAVLGATGNVWNADPAEWAKAINVNLVGTFNTTRAVLPGMIEAGAGKIVNFAGGGAAYAYPLFSAYGASKAAVVRFTETVAVECAPHNIQVNVVAPGAIETEMLQAVRQAGGEVRTVGRMEDAVDLVLFLASSASNHLTGRFIHARDSYREWPPAMAQDLYTLRRVQ